MRDPDSPASSTVFVVEDDAAVARSIVRLVESVGRPVRVYDSAEGYLAGPGAAADDVLLLDVGLPGLSGSALFAALVARGAAPRTIFVSAVDDPRLRVAALDHGARAWLAKPLDADALLTLIDEA